MDKKEQKILEGNINRICLMNFLDGMWFPMSVFVIFLFDNGMSLTQVGLILGAYSIMPFFLDLPSSILADRHSLKLMLVLMSAAYLLQNAIYFFGHSFLMFFIASCFNGIGNALSMGIASALVYDTLLSVGKEKNYEKEQSKVVMSFYAGRLLASVGALIYLANPRMVFLLAVIVTAIEVITAISLKEPWREKGASKPLIHIREGLGFILKHKTIWHTVVIFSVMAGICGVLFDYYQPVMKAAGISVVYFGIIYFFANVAGFLGAVIYPRLAERVRWKGIMFLYLFMAMAAAFFFSVNLRFLIVAAVVLSSLLLGLQGVFIGNVINRIVPSTHRATALSVQTQMHLVFNFVFLMAVSVVSEKVSINAGMVLIFILAVTAFAAFFGLANKEPAVS